MLASPAIFSFIICSKEWRWWGFTNLILWASISLRNKNEKNEKMNFHRIRGAQGMIHSLQYIFCVYMSNLLLTPQFSILEYIQVLQFQEKNLTSINQTKLPDMNWEDLDDLWIFQVTGKHKDTQLGARTCRTHDWAKMHQKCPAIRFCPWNFRECPSPEDMVETCPGPTKTLRLWWS